MGQSSVTDEQHAFWLSYLRQLADLLRLRDWDIELDRGAPDDPNHGAEVAVFYGRRCLRVYLGRALPTYSPEEQRATLTHELIHAHVEPIAEWARLYMSEKEPALEGSFPAMTFRREEEFLVDTLAVIVAPYLPLPEKR